VTHELTRTILTTVQYGAPVAAAVIGMVGPFVPGMAGQILASSAGLLGLLTTGAQLGLARVGNREAAAQSIERGPPEQAQSPPAEPPAETEHGPPAETGPPEEMSGPPAETTGPSAEPTAPDAEQGGPEFGL
jgi:hypothetical protein